MSTLGKVLIGVGVATTAVMVALAVYMAAFPTTTHAGDSVTIGSGATRVAVTLVGPPKRVKDEGDGWCIVRCQLRFKNVGDQLYHTTVYQWCELETTTHGVVVGQSSKGFLDDLLPDTIEMDPGASAEATVDFMVRSATGFKAFSYQGPDDIVVVWKL